MPADNTPLTPTIWQPRHSPWLIALAVMVPTFMEVLDTSIANVSLTHIAGSLSATPDESTWVLTSYLVANAIILPATNWLGNLFGRQRLLLWCIVIFSVASALCGAAGDLGFLVLARALQGVGGGALQPISQSVLLESFPPNKRGAAMALFAMGVVVAPILGPLLGGWITDNYSWRWIFYINLPFGVLAFFMVKAFIEDPPYLERVKLNSLDYLGFGLLAIWLATLQYVLDKGQEDDWFGSHTIVSLTVISCVAFVAFVIWQLKAKAPLVNLRILKNRNFTVGIFLMLILGAVLYGVTAILPLFMQTLLGYPSIDAGYAMSPRGIAAFCATIIIGRIVGKVSNRWLIGFGFALLSLSSFMLADINMSISMRSIIVPTLVNGFAVSCIFVPLTTLTMGYLDRTQMGNAAGIFNLMRNIGGSIGISAITTLVQRGAQTHQSLLVSHLTPFDLPYQQRIAQIHGYLSTQFDPATALHKTYALLNATLEQQATLLSYVDNFRFYGFLCAFCILFIFLFKGVRKKNAAAKPGAASPAETIVAH